MFSSQRSSSLAPGAGGARGGKRGVNGSLASSSASSPAALIGRKIFQQKYSLQLAPGVIDWLDQFVRHFGMKDEDEIAHTFEHLVRGCIGSGSGLGAYRVLSWACGRCSDTHARRWTEQDHD